MITVCFCISLVLQKAGRHMEDTLIASYITLIIGYLIKDNKVACIINSSNIQIAFTTNDLFCLPGARSSNSRSFT